MRAIIAAVRRAATRALFAYTQRFDGVALTAADASSVPRGELAAAAAALPTAVRRALAPRGPTRDRASTAASAEGRGRYRDATGARSGSRSAPLDRVGVYVPGGHGGVSVVGADERDPGAGRRASAR